MSVKAMRRALVLAVSLCAVAFAGPVGAQGEEGRGIDPNQGESLVEVNLPSKDAAIRLQLDAESYGIDFNDHYLRDNQDGSVTVTVFGTDYELAALDLAGFDLGETIEGPEHVAGTRRDAGSRGETGGPCESSGPRPARHAAVAHR